MLRGEAVYELLRYLARINGNVAPKDAAARSVLFCYACGHHLGQHELPENPNPMRCSGAQKEMNRNWCDCDGFVMYYCDQPRLPTAEEIYDSLQ